MRYLKPSILFKLVSVLILNLSFVAAAWSVEITSVGAAVMGKDLMESRDDAIRDALRQASLQVGGSIHSSQMLVDGLVTQDQTQLKTNGQFRHVRVLQEKISNGILEVKVRAEFIEGGQCETNQGNGYRKAVAVAGFALQNPKEAVMGGLNNIEQRLSGVLSSTLNGRHRLHALSLIHI